MSDIYHDLRLYAFGDKKELEAYRKFLPEWEKKALDDFQDATADFSKGTLKSPFRVNIRLTYAGREHISEGVKDLIAKFPNLVFFGEGEVDGRDLGYAGVEWFVAKGGEILGNGNASANPDDHCDDEDEPDESGDEGIASVRRAITYLREEEVDICGWMQDEGFLENLGEIWKDKVSCAALIDIIKEAQGYENYDFSWTDLLAHFPEEFFSDESYKSMLLPRLCDCLQYMPEKLKTTELCLEAVKQSAEFALKYVPEKLKTAEFFLEAAKQGSFVLKHMPEKLKTAELCLEAVKQNGNALEHVPEKLITAELCLEAVKQNGNALEHVPEKLRTAELCLEAVKQGGDALEFVPEKLRTEELCAEAIQGKSWGRDFLLDHVPKTLKPKMKKLIKKLEVENPEPESFSF